MCLAVVLYTVHVILGGGRYISCLSGCCAVVLYTVHVVLGGGRYMSCVSGCGAVYTWMEGALLL